MEEIKNNVNMENIRVNLFCVISLETYGDHMVHDVQTNSTWSENPYDEGYAVVPDEMVPDILATRGFCDITLNEDGTEVVSFTPREIVEPEIIVEPSTEDDILAMLVDQEYRLTLLELGV